jgi:hypothetical protein
LADDDDLQRRELAGQVLCIGDRQEVRLAQAGCHTDGNDQER